MFHSRNALGRVEMRFMARPNPMKVLQNTAIVGLYGTIPQGLSFPLPFASDRKPKSDESGNQCTNRLFRRRHAGCDSEACLPVKSRISSQPPGSGEPAGSSG